MFDLRTLGLRLAVGALFFAGLGAGASPSVASTGPTQSRGCGKVYQPVTKIWVKLRYVKGKADCATVRKMVVRWDRGKTLPGDWFLGMARENDRGELFTIIWTPGGGSVKAELRGFLASGPKRD